MAVPSRPRPERAAEAPGDGEDGGGSSLIPPWLARFVEGTGAVLAILAGVPLLLTSWLVLPTFVELFAQLDAELPAVTQLVVRPGLAPVAGLVPIVIAGVVLARLPPPVTRVPLLLFAVVWGMGLEVLVIFSLYLPLFALPTLIVDE